MMNILDYYLNRITMYRLVFYYLLVLLAAAVVYGFFHILSYSPISIGISTSVLITVSLVTNTIFARVFKAPTNVESVYITPLILTLIISPVQTIHGIIFLTWAAVWAMASKYIFAIEKKHVFNPVAIAVVITALGLNQSASWWIGNTWMMPLILAGGLLIVRKIQREKLVFSFLSASLAALLFVTVSANGNPLRAVNNLFFHSAYFFFAFVMLTEPLTTPPTQTLQILYGTLVGLLFIPQVHIESVYSTPELALVVGNVFSYLVSPKQKLLLILSEKIHVAPGIVDFLFVPDKKLFFTPGQYMEWTLPHKHPDSRGNRRYFTIASSPTEDNIRLGIRFYGNGSSYKKKLATFENDTIVASQLAGDFTLPRNERQKLVFIAGGIGITPFRSMLKYLVDLGQKRDIILFYSNKNVNEIIYKDVFDDAFGLLGIKTVYTLTDKAAIPGNWTGEVGRINESLIKKYLHDCDTRIFYLSGPRTMVNGFEKTLYGMGLKKKQIKKDFFPGFI